MMRLIKESEGRRGVERGLFHAWHWGGFIMFGKRWAMSDEGGLVDFFVVLDFLAV